MVSRIVPYPAEFGGGFCYQLDSSASDRTWFIHLLDSMGQRRAQADGPVRVCDSLLTWLRVPAPDGLPPGPYTVRLGPLRPDTNRRMTMVENRIGYSWLPSGAIDFPVRVIQATPFVPFGAPGPQTVVGQVRLVSTDSQLRAGQPLDLELDWFPTATSDRTLVQSLQLLAPDGRLVAQRDQQPALGAYPTTAWIPGTLFRETITLDVPSGLPAGAYRAILALYDPVTGQREQWSTGEDAVTLAITSLVTP
jgi:hypothetical protein